MMQNLGNRRFVQKCAQKAGLYVLNSKFLAYEQGLTMIETLSRGMRATRISKIFKYIIKPPPLYT